ncbi:SYF2 splicing factor-domain-containing protein [Schizophyllum amplum]|uniref:Pre-mRNA-splicing factor SYF2 n=1 Tax=Schizophyllum amplum TaxID=97359 RepID=A0A550CQ31_9AGAR|nr:SYF2 splicing factor-domain-containing protein [Auriculariopsis ampla]
MTTPRPAAEDIPKADDIDVDDADNEEAGEHSNDAAADKDSRASLQARFSALQKRRAQSQRANMQSLQETTQQTRQRVRDEARLARQRKIAEELRLKADASDPEDVERAKNWSYSIEENDEWEKKLQRKRRRADYEFNDDADASRRKYKKDLDLIKPDLTAYEEQKAQALAGGSSSSALVRREDGGEVIPTANEAHDALYRTANTLLYGDHKPSEEAIDRVVGKVNRDIEKKQKFHRKRINEEEGDITYINEQNRVFNKKISRYYDKYTAEIRASFERGTAL